MNRRYFITAIGIAALWPLRPHAQATMRRVGFLALNNPEPYPTLLRDAFRAAGYVEGKTIQFDFRSADGKMEVLARHAAELVASKVDLIITVQTQTARAVMDATRQIPILFMAGNVLETGLVTSLNRPGGNITGTSTANLEQAVKTLEIMRDTLPSLRTVAALINGRDLGFGKPLLEQVTAAGRSLNIEVLPMIVRGPEELEAAFASLVKQRAQAAVVQPSLPRAQAIELALKHRIALIASAGTWAEAGALICYAPDLRDNIRKIVDYADRIFKGAKPGDLPVQQPTKFELIVNRKTARAIGLTVPQSILLRADRVIE